MTRIKGTHVPRIILALVALAIFFGTLWAELVKRPIDFTRPAWAGVVVAFLFGGVVMLATSWAIGLDTRAEFWITLLMLSLHIFFDSFVLVWVFILDRAIPVPVVQGVVQAYWMAGLIDVVLMFWAQNWQRTQDGFTTPEQENAVLKQENALLEQRLTMLEQVHRSAEAERNKVYTAECDVPGCGWTGEYDNRDSAAKGLAAHQGRAHKEARSD